MLTIINHIVTIIQSASQGLASEFLSKQLGQYPKYHLGILGHYGLLRDVFFSTTATEFHTANNPSSTNHLAADPASFQVALQMSFATVWEHIPIKSMGLSPSARGSGNIEHIERAGLMLMMFIEFL